MKPKKKICNTEDGFLVQLVFMVFYFLERCSVFYWIRILGTYLHEKKNPYSSEKPFVKTYIFPEIWVAGNIVFAIIFERLARECSCKWLLILMIVYAIERVFEMFVYQVNVLFFHRLIPEYMEKTKREKAREERTKTKISAVTQEKSGYVIKSATRTVLMLILNMIEYVLQFAVIFTAVSSVIGTGESYVGIAGSFRVFMNMTNPEDFSGNYVLAFAYIETVIGMFMNIICLARFVGMLPEVAEKGNRK